MIVVGRQRRIGNRKGKKKIVQFKSLNVKTDKALFSFLLPGEPEGQKTRKENDSPKLTA